MRPEELLQNPVDTQTPKLSVGCSVLDRFLGGGIPCNTITELVAESGTGKTQFCLQLLLHSSAQQLSASSLYLHSEFPFPFRRLRQLSLSLPSPSPSLLDRIFVHPIHSAYHLLDLLPHIDSLLTRLPIKLIVIDSMAALFRSEFDNNPSDLKRRSSLFFKISSKLKAQAIKYGIAIVMTNQVVDVMEESSASSTDNALRIGNSECLYTSGRRVCAALGLSWAHCVNIRLFLWRQEERLPLVGGSDGDIDNQLQQTTTRRFIRVVFAPHLPDSCCQFVIKREGVFGID